MKSSFQIGTHKFHDEPNMNYSFNRVYAVNGGDLGEITEVSKRIRTLEDWNSEFLDLAKKAESEKRFRHASAYYRGAHFFLHPDDPRKKAAYESYLSHVREINREELADLRLEETEIPYEGGALPVWHVGPPKDAGARCVIVMHLGNDSLKEELIPALRLFREAGMDFYLFEGPGQGEALYKHGLTMSREWEKPVTAVLDHFRLDDVTLIGLSLGGYLAPRAAAFEPRVKRVVAWGVMFDFFDVVVSRRGKALEMAVKALIGLGAAALLDAIVRAKMRTDTYAKWGLEHGCFMMGVRTPFEYFKKILGFSMKDISELVTQDFLLIGNRRDHFIPEGQFCLQAAALTKVRSFTGRIFTEAERAENHVGFGNAPLVLEYIIGWIREHTARSGV